MERPQILLIGKVGQVGWELNRTLAPMADISCVDYPEIDLTQPDSIRDRVRACQPRIIINAAAYTAVDKAETDYERALSINGTAPGILAEEAAKLDALLVHYSTDYVYDGAKQMPWVETDKPSPLSAYGRSKLAGDEAIVASGCAHLIFRLCWVYGARGQNFMLTMMRLAREREELKVVADQTGCPTWSRMIAESTALALGTVLASGDTRQFSGIYHLAASGQTSWHGFAQEIVEQMKPEERKCARVTPIPSSDYPTPARRPAFSVLDCGKLARTFRLRLPDWKASLNQVFDH